LYGEIVLKEHFGLKSSAVIGALLTSVALPVAAQSSTAGPDLTALTNNISFGTVLTAILAVGGLLASVYLALKGARIVLAMLRGA